MIFKKKICFIVDGYSTGKYLAPALIANGYTCWHINSNDNNTLIPFLKKSFIKDNFPKSFNYKDNNVDEILRCVSPHQVKMVISGSEPGIELADLLAEKLGLPGNPSVSSKIRRNKFSMYEALKKNNIPAALFIKSNNPEELIQWKKQHNLTKVVLKPLLDFASNDVFICESENKLNRAGQYVLSKTNSLKQSNLYFLAQEFLEGQEYIVNTVSVNGKHSVIDIWKKYKTWVDGQPVNLYAEAIDASTKEYNELVDYTYQTLNALQIDYGPAHTELMLTKKGVRLIETGARLAGSIDPSAVNEIYGNNQVLATINALINPKQFIPDRDISLQKNGLHFYFINPLTRKIKNSPNFDKMLKLPSLHSLFFNYDKNEISPATTSLITCPGNGYLISSSKAEIMNDYNLFRQYEKIFYKDMFYSF